MTQKLFLALACCLALIVITAPPVSAQGQTPTKANDAYTWRDTNGNLHYQDEDGNYFINSGSNNGSTDIQSDVNRNTTTIEREKSSEPQNTQSDRIHKKDMNKQTTRDNSVGSKSNRAAAKTDSNLPRTAGELPLIGLIGLLSLAGTGAARLVWNTKR